MTSRFVRSLALALCAALGCSSGASGNSTTGSGGSSGASTTGSASAAASGSNSSGSATGVTSASSGSTSGVVATAASTSATGGSVASTGASTGGPGSSTGSSGSSTSSGSATSGGLALGTATVLDAGVKCGVGGASCTILNVACGSNSDTVTIADLEPSGTPIGTIVAHNGGEGTSFFSNDTSGKGFDTAYVSAGYRYVQLAWDNNGWAGNGVGIKTSGCLPATAFYWIWKHIHDQSTSLPFCGTGESGGAAALLYSLAGYGMKAYFDYMVLSAGPTPSRIDYGCKPPLYDGGPRDLCPVDAGASLPDAPYAYDTGAANGGGDANVVDNWEGTNHCDYDGGEYVSASDLQQYEADELVSQTNGNDLSYMQTGISFWYCVPPSPNVSTGQSTFFLDAVGTMAHPVAGHLSQEINCFAGNAKPDAGVCYSEYVFYPPNGPAFTQAVNEMKAGCKPHH